MQENFKHKKLQQIGMEKNAPVLIKIVALVCSSTFSAKQRTQEAKWKKTKRKNAEDGWANEEMWC